ncbi:uncharacterized protein EI90DRAFT_3041131, partial [Cantharellus anzutake]|uniref:uncharacterized protein n=1 Tax=Cantharellus anzutake TaxID=1750568 RepID=UPI0019033F17
MGKQSQQTCGRKGQYKIHASGFISEREIFPWSFHYSHSSLGKVRKPEKYPISLYVLLLGIIQITRTSQVLPGALRVPVSLHESL